MNKTSLVSVIIPVYKVEKFLAGCINSVLAQTYKNIEIILVDDGSPDNCPIICDDFATRYKDISVIHKKNGGLSDARNFGLNKATGEYILFLDSDDKLLKDAVQGLIEAAIKTEADIVVPDRYFKIIENKNTKKLCYHFRKHDQTENPIEFVLNVIIGKGRAWRAHALLYKREIIKKNKIEFPVGYIAEDIVFNLDVYSKAKKITFYNKPTLYYLKRSGSITTSFQENMDEVFFFIDKKVQSFLQNNNQLNPHGEIKRKELLCRNSIIYISSIFTKNTWDKKRRTARAEDFLYKKEIQDAFKIKKINPYFDNTLTVVYFKLMFWLIKLNFNSFAFRIAKISGSIK